jgi:hypothetical protein
MSAIKPTLPASHATALAAARRVLGGVPGAVAARGAGAPLDLPRDAGDPPRLDRAPALEPGDDRPRVVPPLTGELTRAFLDGVQRTERVGYAAGVVPLVQATCAAVVRVRDAEGRLHTWANGLARTVALYAPRAMLGADVIRALEDAGFTLRDTAPDAGTTGVHPLSLDRAALDAVRTDRAQLERALAERWVADGDGWLWVDGPLPGDAASRAPNVFGVVKSHRTLYADDDRLEPLLALRAGERSRVFDREAATRVRVASWYLRLRNPEGEGPLHGLVRIEAAISEAPVGPRADSISALVLAERQPLARPDPRWDVMAYPIRDAEAVLKALL